ncbi:MAG: flavodoxin domain-containing protein [Deltaproteobacteria bacterium]|nr:flavodoxin domain-containing protein [Deltaproteobacteria bacterium]
MARVLIVYSTRTGQTKKIAELIAEGIRFEGPEAKVTNVTQIKKKTDLQGYDGYVFGSATYHGEMMQPMKTMLFLAEKANLEGKMDMVDGPLRLKSSSLGGGTQMAQDYGKEIARSLT